MIEWGNVEWRNVEVMEMRRGFTMMFIVENNVWIVKTSEENKMPENYEGKGFGFCFRVPVSN